MEKGIELIPWYSTCLLTEVPDKGVSYSVRTVTSCWYSCRVAFSERSILASTRIRVRVRVRGTRRKFIEAYQGTVQAQPALPDHAWPGSHTLPTRPQPTNSVAWPFWPTIAPRDCAMSRLGTNVPWPLVLGLRRGWPNVHALSLTEKSPGWGNLEDGPLTQAVRPVSLLHLVSASDHHLRAPHAGNLAEAAVRAASDLYK